MAAKPKIITFRAPGEHLSDIFRAAGLRLALAGGFVTMGTWRGIHGMIRRESTCPRRSWIGNRSGRHWGCSSIFARTGCDSARRWPRLFTGSLLSLAFPYLAGSIVDAAVHQMKGTGAMGGVDRTALLLVGILACKPAFLISIFFRSPRWDNAAWSICGAIPTRD